MIGKLSLAAAIFLTSLVIVPSASASDCAGMVGDTIEDRTGIWIACNDQVPGIEEDEYGCDYVVYVGGRPTYCVNGPGA